MLIINIAKLTKWATNVAEGVFVIVLSLCTQFNLVCSLAVPRSVTRASHVPPVSLAGSISSVGVGRGLGGIVKKIFPHV